MLAAVDALDRDRFAATSHAARASWLRTWHLMHAAAFQKYASPPPAFPLTPDIITRVAALFKAGGYMSFDNYAMRAKSEHLSMALVGPGAWTAELSAALRSAIRSCGRGVGSSRQSKPLDPVAVAALELPDTPLNVNGPVAPSDFAVAGCFFLTREVELAAARVAHITFSPDSQSVTGRVSAWPTASSILAHHSEV